MRALIVLLLLMALPARAAMDITRELEVPEHVAPGQPVKVVVTFWTDSWFNPPPEWPEFKIINGSLLTTPLPNQLLTRQKNGISWSGIRMERPLAAWDQGLLRLPALDVTLSSPGQPPVTVHLPELKKEVIWPKGVEQPDRFLPASHLEMTQKIALYHASKDNTLHAGDVVERTVTVKAGGVMATQIPQLLYAIPGTDTQRLTPVNAVLKEGRGDVEGGLREERLRYLPSQAGTITLPPIKLRWWDTAHQQWQLAELPGASMEVAQARAAGSESALRGTTGEGKWLTALSVAAIAILALLIWFSRRVLWRSYNYLRHVWRRFWDPVQLPELSPTKRGK